LVSVLMLALLPRDQVSTYVAAGVVAGISINGWQGAWILRLTELAGAARAGTATGLALTFMGISLTASPLLYGALADATGTLRSIWVGIAFMLVLACGTVLLMPSSRRRTAPQPA